MKSKYLAFCLTLLFTVFSVPALAQTVVRGTVTDASGMPVIAAGVVESGTTNGVITDVDGNYSIRVASGNSSLEFSCIGYEPQTVPVNGHLVIDVVMQESASFLEEAVAIGYGTQKVADITSSVQSVKAEAFNKGAVLDAGQLIQGKVAGLQITVSSGNPEAASAVSLRGLSSLMGSTAPLILIDGVPGNFSTVAPEDIESIDVLKDGSATAIYGTRGTNGVIIITTRNAKREMPATVEYSGYVSASTFYKVPDFLQADDLREAWKQGWSWSGANDKDYEASVNWLNEISRTGISHNHNLSIMGGTRHNTYTANVSYRNNQGTMLNTGQTNLRARAQVAQYMFDDKVKLTAEVLAGESESATRFDPGYVYRMACIQNPTQPIYDDNGDYVERDVYFYDNPMSRIFETKGMYRNRNVRFMGQAEYKPFEVLTLKGMYVRKGQNSISGDYTTHKHVNTTESGRNGTAGRGASEYINNMLELSANYVQDFGKHHLTGVAGYSYEDHTNENFSMSNYDFPTDMYLYNNMEIGNALKDGDAGMYSYKSRTKLIGLFARATYNYDDRYLLMVSLRRDGSSKFGKDHKWGNFPGVSAGWRISNEEFMKQYKWLNNLKLRAGYGITGIDVSSPYQSLASLDYSGYMLYNNEWIPVLTPVRNANPELRWEKKLEYNLGLDFAMFEERLSGSIDVYQRDTKDAIYDYSVPVPPYQYGSMLANVAHIRNRGVEILLNATPVHTQSFMWNTSATFSANENQLVKITPPEGSDLEMTTNYFDAGYTGEPIQTSTHRVKEGWPIGNFYGLKSLGLNSSGKWVVERYRYEDGKVVARFPDLAESASAADWQVLGNGVPRFYANWNNNLTWKNWDLAVTMRGALGFQILNFQKLFYGNPTIQYNLLKSAFDELPVVDDKTGVLTGEKTTIKDSQRYVSYYIENGDYWKIDNVTLGYNLNFKEKYMRRLRLYASVHNLATITKYTGLDPEVRVSGFDPGTDDRDKYPTIRSFTFGAVLTFGAGGSDAPAAPAADMGALAAAKDAAARAEAALAACQADREKMGADWNADKQTIKNLEAELARAKGELAAAKTASEYFESPIVAFFEIGKYVLSNSEKERVKMAAKDILANGGKVKFTLSGNADKGTGTPTRNEFLARERANTVMNLMHEMGVDTDNFSINYGVEDIFDTPELNRCVIIEKQ